MGDTVITHLYQHGKQDDGEDDYDATDMNGCEPLESELESKVLESNVGASKVSRRRKAPEPEA